MPPQRKNYKTRRYTRDLDQIERDLKSPKQLQQHLSIVPSDERPGLGQYYCIPCARFLETEAASQTHERGKPHKKRVKSLLGDQYTQREADAAVGLGVDHGIVVPKVIPSDVLAKISRNRIIAPEQEIKKMDVDDNVTAETTDTVAEDDAL